MASADKLASTAEPPRMPRLPPPSHASKRRPLSLASLPIWQKLRKLQGDAFIAAFEAFAREKQLNPSLPGLWLALAEIAAHENFLPQALLATERSLSLLSPPASAPNLLEGIGSPTPSPARHSAEQPNAVTPSAEQPNAVTPSAADHPQEGTHPLTPGLSAPPLSTTAEDSPPPADLRSIHLFYAKLLVRSGLFEQAKVQIQTFSASPLDLETLQTLLLIAFHQADASALLALGPQIHALGDTHLGDLAQAHGFHLQGSLSSALPFLRKAVPSLLSSPPSLDPLLESTLFSAASLWFHTEPDAAPSLLPLLWKRPVPRPDAWQPLLSLALRFGAWAEIPRLASQAPPALVSAPQSRFLKALSGLLLRPPSSLSSSSLSPSSLSSLPPKLLDALHPSILGSLPHEWQTSISQHLRLTSPLLFLHLVPPTTAAADSESAEPTPTDREARGVQPLAEGVAARDSAASQDGKTEVLPSLGVEGRTFQDTAPEAPLKAVWSGLPERSQRLLEEGEWWLESLDEGRDHAPVLLQWSRAAEEALNRILLDPFVAFAEERLGLRAERDLPRLGGRWLKRSGNAVTLGSMPYLFAEQWLRLDTEAILAGDSQPSEIVYNYQVTSGQRLLWESWKRKLRKEGHPEGDITFFFSELPAVCQTWATLRNRVVHDPAPLPRQAILALRHRLLFGPSNLFRLALLLGGSLPPLSPLPLLSTEPPGASQ